MGAVKRTVTVTMCDLCGSEDSLTVTIAVAGEQPFRVDLCPEHRKPIDALVGHSAPSSAPRKPPIRVVPVNQSTKKTTTPSKKGRIRLT